MNSQQILAKNLFLSAFLILLSAAVPVLGFLAGLFLPLPIMHAAYHREWRISMIVAAAGTALMATSGLLPAALYLVETVVPAMSSIWLIQRSPNPLRAVVQIGMALGIGLLAGLAILLRISTGNPVLQVLQAAGAALNRAGLQDVIGSDMDRIVTVVYHVSIGLIISGVMLSLIVCFSVLLRRSTPANPAGGFLRFAATEIPRHYLILLAGAIAGCFGSFEFLRVAAASTLFALYTLYCFQGFLVMNMAFRRRNVPLPLQFFIYFIIAVQPLFSVLVTALGVIETWAQFRTRMIEDWRHEHH